MFESQMSLPTPSSPATKRRPEPRPTASISAAGELPPDLLCDVLLSLPAKDLCRLRAVNHTWRSLLTADPLFADAHAGRHRGPLLLATFHGDDARVHVVGLSSGAAVVKRVVVGDGHRHHRLLRTRLDVACVSSQSNTCRVLHPATGASYPLPESPAAAHVNRANVRRPYTFHAMGKVPSTGEYKVLRMFNRMEFTGFDEDQLFEVLTLVNGDGLQAQWRARNSCGVFVEGGSAIVVEGIVYFKVDKVYHSMLVEGVDPGVLMDCVFSFDLEKEQWRKELQGPIGVNLLDGDYDDDFVDYHDIWNQLSFAELRGSLVLVYFCDHRSVMDLWILEDFENGVWVKEFNIRTLSIMHPTEVCRVEALFGLDDGRLVIHIASAEVLLIYDPGTDTFEEVEMGPHLDAVAMYTGTLLSSQLSDRV